ncbi:MAG: hypothetical protein GY854_31220 [Deltaproteobacteria bacterium]|nr:hypothetical protein [Deltaproteobacteria bacterium]
MGIIPDVYEWHVLDDLPGSWDRAANHAVVHDSQGNVYIAGCASRTNDTTLRFLQRLDSEGIPFPAQDETFPWYNGATDYYEWTDFPLQRIAIDEQRSRLYVLTAAYRYDIPGLPRYFLNAHDIVTGDRIWAQYIGWSFEEKAFLDIDAEGNIWTAITDGTDNTTNIIKLCKFDHAGSKASLTQDGVLYTQKNRVLFAVATKKQSSSLYLAYKEWDSSGVDDLVVACYSHDIAFVEKETFQLNPDAPAGSEDISKPEFHDAIVDTNDRLVLGGFFTCEKEVTLPENFGRYRNHYPVVMRFNTDCTEHSRYVNNDISAYSGPVEFFDLDYLPSRVKSIIRHGEGADVLYGQSLSSATLCIREDGTERDLEYLGLDTDHNDVSIGGCEYLAKTLNVDFTYLPLEVLGPRRIIRAGGSVLISGSCTGNQTITDRPSIVSFFDARGWLFSRFHRFRYRREQYWLPLPTQSERLGFLHERIPFIRGTGREVSIANNTQELRQLGQMVISRLQSKEILQGMDEEDILLKIFRAAPKGRNFTEDLQVGVCKTIESNNRNEDYEHTLMEALNAITIDSISPDALPGQRCRIKRSDYLRFGDWATVVPNGKMDFEQPRLEITAGCDSIPEGTDVVWPVVVFNFSNLSHSEGRVRISWKNFQFRYHPSRLRLMAIEGKRMIDITEKVDISSRMVTGRVKKLDKVLLLQVKPDHRPAEFSHIKPQK